MKLLRTLLTVLLLLLMPFAVQADDYVPQYNHQPVPANRIKYTLPLGLVLAQPVSTQDGKLTIVVDSEKTDWASVLASMSESDTIEVALSAIPAAGAVNQKNLGLGNGYDPEKETLLESALREFDMAAQHEISRPNPPGSVDDWNSVTMAYFDADSSSIVPEQRGSNHYYAHLIIWNADTANPICEYYFVDIRFTDASARKVSTSEIDSSRIIAHTASGVTSIKSDGSVSYQLPNNHTISRLKTCVAAPSGAKSYASFSSKGVGEPMLLSTVETENGMKSCATIERRLSAQEYADLHTATILWYKDEEGKNLHSIECVEISVTVGDPQPYPRYLRQNGELMSIPTSRLIVPLYLNDKSKDSSFINMRYEDDTYRITLTPSQVPDGLDLEDCGYEYLVVAPKDAVCYSVSSHSSSVIYGTQEKHYEEHVAELTDLSNRLDEFFLHHDQRVISLGGPMLSNSRTFSHNPDLKLYVPTTVTGPYAGGVKIIYWYDGFGEDANLILKEYFITKTDPFSVTQIKEVLTDESQLPSAANMLLPVIILDEEDAHVNTGRTLYLAIENHVYAGKNCVVYGLHVQDDQGNMIDLKNDATIILPYPKGMGMGSPGSYTLNHYDEEKGLIRYSEDSTDPKYRLTRIPHGIKFKNQTFSPFVLSWEGEDVLSDDIVISDLPKTGDSSLPITFFAGLLSLCAASLFLLRKIRA